MPSDAAASSNANIGSILKSKHMNKYIIRDREAGNVIEECLTLEEAKGMLQSFIDSDKEDGIHEPEFYEIFREIDYQEEGFDSQFEKVGYGHWLLTVTFYNGEKFTAVTTNPELIDNWHEEECQLDVRDYVLSKNNLL